MFLTKVDLPVPENPLIMIPFKGPSPFYKYCSRSLIDEIMASFASWSSFDKKDVLIELYTTFWTLFYLLMPYFFTSN